MSAQATPTPVTGAGQVVAAAATLRGWSLYSTPGDTVTLYDGLSATGTVLATVVIPATGAVTFALPDGLRAAKGIYLQSTGALTGSVWIG